jgi:hypothetical protein
VIVASIPERKARDLEGLAPDLALPVAEAVLVIFECWFSPETRLTIDARADARPIAPEARSPRPLRAGQGQRPARESARQPGARPLPVSARSGPRIYRGLEEIGAATLEWLEAWDSYWMTAEDFIEARDEIVMFMHLHARAAGTDRVTEQRTTAVWTLRNGRAVRVRYYDDRAEALEAAGLSE